MPSFQEPAGGSKSTKFVGTGNLLDPMMRPFQQQQQDAHDVDDDPQQEHLTDDQHVNDRLSKAVQELQVRHERGCNERDHPDRAPTGSAYQQQTSTTTTSAGTTQQTMTPSRMVTPDSKLQQTCKNSDDDSDGESDDDYDWLLDEDNNNGDDGDDDGAGLRALRERRLRELRERAEARAADLARGHGQVRTVSQDEFLPETCGSSSEWVVCHFFHREFRRCAVLDDRLQQAVAPLHTECKFLRIDAEKAPFFVAKLQIRVLPTLLVLQHGKVVDRLIGFEELLGKNQTQLLPPQRHFAERPTVDPDAWETSALQTWLAGTGAIQYSPIGAERAERLSGSTRRRDAAETSSQEDDY